MSELTQWIEGAILYAKEDAEDLANWAEKRDNEIEAETSASMLDTVTSAECQVITINSILERFASLIPEMAGYDMGAEPGNWFVSTTDQSKFGAGGLCGWLIKAEQIGTRYVVVLAEIKFGGHLLEWGVKEPGDEEWRTVLT